MKKINVMIQLREDLAIEVQNQISRSEFSEIDNQEINKLIHLLTDLHVRLIPVHPGQSHPLLASHFMVETKEKETAEKIVEQLNKMDFIKSAYIKPAEELP